MTLTQLTPLELNKFRFSGNHTPLTPEQLAALRAAAPTASPASASATTPVHP